MLSDKGMTRMKYETSPIQKRNLPRFSILKAGALTEPTTMPT